MADSQESEVVVVGARAHPLRDAYHAILRMGWFSTIAAIAAVFLALNAVFAVGYMAVGGVAGSHGKFADAFFFSVQTMGTIGYGAMFPQSLAANVLVVAESVVGLIVTALATGLVFAKFSLSHAAIAFSREVAIAPLNGVPTMSFRVGNERANTIVDAHVRVAMIRTEITEEGVTYYRMTDLVLSRDRSPAMSRSWNVFHPIVEGSPFHGMTPESIARCETELIVTVVGTDDTSLQPVHGRHRYVDKEIVWGARHADVLSEGNDGKLVLDIRKFHDLVPTKPTETFPYPRDVAERT